MKMIVSILVESPFYFSMSLRDRFRLVRRLIKKEKSIDLQDYQTKISLFLKSAEPSLVKVASV
ncbi:MAG: hypothetical protein C4567_04100 [Deltaproteobacteria bacterium]|nr:MAG: hypothetical protein C4567_04100 [Deltaproteobacteria bacterium]